jgi:hypothetical protein
VEKSLILAVCIIIKSIRECKKAQITMLLRQDSLEKNTNKEATMKRRKSKTDNSRKISKKP